MSEVRRKELMDQMVEAGMVGKSVAVKNLYTDAFLPPK
ncbi:MAG: hypothetical protein JWL84_1995 [Rhodospirillales bacterium]|nr:hypothetical protein [Rhodospirillales bacterium]